MAAESPFVLFGPSHLATLVTVVAVAVAVPLWARRRAPPTRQRVATGLAALLVVWRLAEITVRNLVYDIPLKDQLPLHLCGVLVFVSAWMLWKRSYAVYEVVYFWAFGGTVQALLTPDLPVGFPHPAYLLFFFSHGLLILAALYATLVFGFRPTPRSILKAMLWVNVYALLVAPVNLLLDTNYLYLRHKPERASLLDHFGPWPWYLGVLELIGLTIFALCYVPFWIRDLRRPRAASE